MNGNQPVGAPDPTDPLANPVPAQRIPDIPSPTPEDFFNWVHERMQEQPPMRPKPPKITGGQMWDLQHSVGPVQQLIMNKIMMSDPANRDYMAKQAAYEEHQKQLGQILPVVSAQTRGEAIERAARERSEAALARLGYKWVVDQNGENVLIHVGVGQQGGQPAGIPQTSGQPPINMASPSPTPEPSMKVRPGTPSNVSSAPGQSVNVLRSSVKSMPKPPQYQLGTDAAGNQIWFPKPGQGQLSAMPAVSPGGQPTQKPPSATDITTQSSINSLMVARKTIQNMIVHYDDVQRQAGLGSIALGGAMSIPGLRAIAGRPGVTRQLGMGTSGPSARMHEADRQALKLEMQKVEASGNRVLLGVLQAILEQIPSISEAPEVAHPMYQKLLDNVDQTLRMYQAIPGAQTGGGGGQPPQGRKTPQQLWDEINAGR